MGEKYKLLSKTFYGERVCSDMLMKFTKFTCDEDIVNNTMKSPFLEYNDDLEQMVGVVTKLA